MSLSQQKTPNVEEVNENVDILMPTKPIKEFQEFNKDFDDVIKIPDYKFRIDKISSLVREEEVKVVGKVFPSKVLSCSFQIKCVVKSDEFQLFIAFVKPETGKGYISRNLSIKVTTAILGRHPLSSDLNEANEFFCYYFPEELIAWEIFYPFCKFSYNKNIQKINILGKDHVVLHLLMRDCRSDNDVLVKDGILNWKVDALISKVNSGVIIEEEDEVGLSPVFYKEPNGMRVQVRLFTRGTKCVVQINFWNETDENLEYPLIDFKIFHHEKLTQTIHFVFDPLERKIKEMEARDHSFVSFQFAKVEELVQFIDRFLLVRIKI